MDLAHVGTEEINRSYLLATRALVDTLCVDATSERVRNVIAAQNVLLTIDIPAGVTDDLGHQRPIFSKSFAIRSIFLRKRSRPAFLLQSRERKMTALPPLIPL